MTHATVSCPLCAYECTSNNMKRHIQRHHTFETTNGLIVTPTTKVVKSIDGRRLMAFCFQCQTDLGSLYTSTEIASARCSNHACRPPRPQMVRKKVEKTEKSETSPIAPSSTNDEYEALKVKIITNYPKMVEHTSHPLIPLDEDEDDDDRESFEVTILSTFRYAANSAITNNTIGVQLKKQEDENARLRAEIERLMILTTGKLPSTIVVGSGDRAISWSP